MMNYRREIDGLRALAVMPVILFHAGFETFSGGFVGVDVFFVISGYLITTIILSELAQGKFSIIKFYERRARRILPALFLVMFVSTLFAWFWLLPGDMKDYSQSLVAVSFFVSNILFWSESGYFDTATELKPLLHTWSLAVEEQYYIFFPLLLMLFWKLGKRWILLSLGVLFVASLALAQWAAYEKPTAGFYLLPTRIWELLIGAFAAFHLSIANRKEFSKVASEISGWLGVLFILSAVFIYSKETPFPGFYALIPTLGALLIILFATPNTYVGKFVGNRLFVGIGLISYSAYLWHQPLFAFVRHAGFEHSHVLFLLLSALTLAIAYLSYRYVEAPFRKAGTITRSQIFSMGAVFTMLFAIFGYVGDIKNGFEGRFQRLLAGDIGHVEFHSYMDSKYFDCEPKTIAQNALSFDGFLRCKQSKQGTPEVVILGDSHAEHLFLGLAEYMPSKNVAFYIHGAKPYIESEEFKGIFNELFSNNKHQHILITMQFIGRLDEKGAGLYEGFSRTINALQKAGKSVTLIGDIPRFNQDPGLCVYSFSNYSSSSCSLSLEDVKRQRDIYDAVLARLAAEYALNYERIDQTLCSENGCSMAKDNSILYRDTNHLNIIGSKFVGKILAEKLHIK
jgi:peptidoglycan/LPS O-acetylase OafA/YrhL